MIIENEDELFEFVKAEYMADLTSNSDIFCPSDCYSRRHKVEIELKSRQKHYNRLLIERKKYDALIERAKRKGGRPLYINSTPEGVWVWDLSTVSLDWEVRKLPARTYWESEEKREGSSLPPYPRRLRLN